MDACTAAEFMRKLRMNRPDFDPITWNMLAVDKDVLPVYRAEDVQSRIIIPGQAECTAQDSCIIDAIQLTTRPQMARGITDTKAYIITTTSDGVFQLVPNNPNRRLFAVWANGAFISIGASPEQVGSSIQSVTTLDFPTFICDENMWGMFAAVQWFFRTTSVAPIRICVWEEIYIHGIKKEKFA